MKSFQGGMSFHVGTSHLMRATTMAALPIRGRASDYSKEWASTAVTLMALFAVIFVLYVVMFVGLYRWSHYDPILPQDYATGAVITLPLE